MRLLVVEDEHSLREDIARKLRLSGYEVDACADGEAALEALAAERYDLVLLDLNLPKVDGMQVLRTLRRHDLETCVLILSARSEIADKVGAILMIDTAHPAGLIAAGLLDNPVKYAHIVTSTTHKTLRGPRGGVIMMGKDFPNPWGKKTPKGEIKMMSQLLDSAVFPGIQGGPLEHVIAAKAVAFGECLQPEYKEYQTQVKKNAAVLAQALIDRGFTIVSGGTDNHSMLVDLRTKYPDLTGKVAEKALVAADITVNKNMVPFDSRSAFQTSGIRLGTPAITTRGAKEDLMLEIAEMIETVLSNVDNEEVIAQVRARVNETMKKYPIFAY